MNAETKQHTPVLLGKVHRMPPCGCDVKGDGTLQHPIEIVPCRLHAASPDLLAACEALVYELRNVAWQQTRDLVEQAKAAIAKATGRDND